MAKGAHSGCYAKGNGRGRAELLGGVKSCPRISPFGATGGKRKVLPGQRGFGLSPWTDPLLMAGSNPPSRPTDDAARLMPASQFAS